MIPEILEYVIPVSIVVGSLLVGLLTRSLVLKTLSSWASRTRWKFDDLLVESIRGPYVLWWLILGLYIALLLLKATVAAVPDRTLWEQAINFVHPLLLALLLLSMTLAAASFLGKAIRHYTSQVEPSMPAPTLPRTLVRLTVLVIGLLMVLGVLGIPITPILTALGIGGLAVALALQDTLTNLFAGFYVTIARQIRVGQRVKLESGEEGYVSDIGWRTTTLRTPSNHLVIIPNAKLAQSIITNYNMPDPPVNIVIPVGVSYDSDPEHVERVLKEEARRAINELPGFVKNFEPIVRFQEFADFSLNFLLIVRVENFDAQFAVWGELHKRIFKRFTQEDIEIPFPVRTIYVKDGASGLKERVDQR